MLRFVLVLFVIERQEPLCHDFMTGFAYISQYRNHIIIVIYMSQYKQEGPTKCMFEIELA